MELPSVLDLVAAPSLHESITGRRGTELILDAGGVQRLGAQCLQILLAARAAWAADEVPFAVEHHAGEFAAALELMGVAPEDLSYSPPDGTHQDQKELAA